MAFCKEFNARTKDAGGMVVPVVISVYQDKSFTFITKSPPASVLLKKAAGIASGSKQPNKEKVGKVTRKQVLEIVKLKGSDLNAASDEAAIRVVAGTARSMAATCASDRNTGALANMCGRVRMSVAQNSGSPASRSSAAHSASRSSVMQVQSRFRRSDSGVVSFAAETVSRPGIRIAYSQALPASACRRRPVRRGAGRRRRGAPGPQLCFGQYWSRSRRFSSLPVGVRGSSARKSTLRGHLIDDRLALQKAISSSARAWPGA